jgi:mRNA-degrading endonuclease RelE of RelBE toxin-antitoxin system
VISARYSVLVSDQVKAVLQELHQSDRAKCRTLALLLLRLEKDPKPEGSRELRPDGEPAPGERLWEHGEFKIAYRVDERTRVVEVGTIGQRRS